MCGIAGVVGDYRREQAGAAIEAMTAAQFHRGPDDGGTEIIETRSGSIALGARRLAILDLTPAGHQPMTDEVTGNVLTYNGEIYNFPELRDELVARGHTFHGRGDTEVILVGYREWGRAVLDKLRGMFAFALWDARKQRLLVARDHLGIKPLYYASTAAGFVCSSEVRAILAGGLVDATLDRRGLAGYLAYGAVQEPFTIVEQIRALAAGCWMEIDATGATVAEARYWDFPAIEPPEMSEDDLVAHGRELLERAVKRHMLSDVPLGVFLSSGLDSTAVAGLAQLASDHDVHAFTVSFPEDAALNESPVARKAAERLGLMFHDVPVDRQTALEWATSGLDAMDQPAMDGLNTYIVARAVREAGLTVALSGQGGDEVFGGYRAFTAVPTIAKVNAALGFVPARMRSAVAATIARPGGRVRSEKARDVTSVTNIRDIYFMFRRMLPDRDMRALGYTAASSGLTANFLDPRLSERALVAGDPVATVGRHETQFYLGNTLLRDGDVYGMASSLEIRVPMLDRDVVDWAFSLPGDVLLPRGKPPKHLLRTMCNDVLGADQLQRPKQGFNLPLATWMKGPLAQVRSEALDALIASGLVSADGVRSIERAYLDDRYRSAGTRAWGLVALGRWLTTQGTSISI